MAIADTITSMQNHTSNAYTMIGYGTDLTGINKNLENLSTSIFNAFLEALRTPDTLFTNLPKKSGTGANITLNDTANTPMRIELGASELTQDGTPTPSSPQDIHTISGSNTIKVEGKNKAYNNIIGKYFYDTGAWASDSKYVTTLANVENGKTYTISQGNASSVYFNRLGQYNGDNVSLTNVTSIASTSGTYTFTSNFDGIVAICWRLTTSVDFQPQEVQVEVGSADTTYTPYISQEADIDLGYKNLYNVFAEKKSLTRYTTIDENGWITMEYNNTNGSSAVYPYYSTDNLDLKTSTQYNLLVEIKELSGNFAIEFASTATPSQNATNIYTGSNNLNVGTKQYLITTKSSFTGTNEGLRSVMVINAGQNAKITYRISVLENISITPAIYKYSPYKLNPLEYCKIGNYEDKFIRNSGKNLLDLTGISGTNNNVQYSVNSGGQLVLNGACNSDRVTINLLTAQTLNGTFTFSTNYLKPTALKNSLGANLFLTTGSNGVKTETINDTATQLVIYGLTGITFNNQVIQLQVEKGTITTPEYEPYGNGTWYIKKNIGKYQITGSESGNIFYWNNEINGMRLVLDNAIKTIANAPLFCNRFKVMQSSTTEDNYVRLNRTTDNNYLGFWFGNVNISGVNNEATFKTWASSNEVILCYPLNTPEYLPITGTLAEQLENVYQKMLSQKGQTNISQVNNDLSFNLSVQAIEEL